MLLKHADDLAGKIEQLQIDRRHHLDAMAAIDRALSQIEHALRGAPQPDRAGTSPAPSDPSRPQATPVLREIPPAPGFRRRGRFEVTGMDSVFAFIRRQVDPSTAEINAHWRNEGRKGTANVTILKLLKDGLIRREHDPSIRGSRYRQVERSATMHAGRLNTAAARG
jgi:hypothetical protein